MKVLTILLLFILTTSVFCQDTEIIESGDTTIIRASNITVDPFMFGDNAMISLRKTDSKVSIQTYQNRHVDNKVDTLFSFAIGTDKFDIYQLTKDENILISATLATNKFKTRHGIRIGMTKKDVLNKLKEYGIRSIPEYLILEALEYPEFITLRFKKEILIKIDFEGYID